MAKERESRKPDSAAVVTDINVQDVRANWAETLNRVHYRGERFRIVRFGKPVAVLVPINDAA